MSNYVVDNQVVFLRNCSYTRLSESIQKLVRKIPEKIRETTPFRKTIFALNPRYSAALRVVWNP